MKNLQKLKQLNIIKSHFSSGIKNQQVRNYTSYQTPQVLVAVANGSEEIETVTITDVLTRSDIHVTLVKVLDEKEASQQGGIDASPFHKICVMSRGLKLIADDILNDNFQNRDFDMIVLPGGGLGAQNFAKSQILIDFLRNHAHHNRYIAAICASPAVVLKEHGFIGDKQATCYPGFINTMTLDNYVDEKVVVSGKLITSQGPATSMEFALKLVKILKGQGEADKNAKDLLFDAKHL
ncbi:UNKNOWN [Stylonychia lemnae]|uniref:DJ-1/PfpI domain-containing protein n=1 Tax=Stylonychia lemnae TaxID=5949 RepID=A0A077ZTX4_STYLE|nr:UNKNOWN [Stylonychia lemnae]|eukprot:CDW71901.1 UNKNOWN [Stylonychia lemnae]